MPPGMVSQSVSYHHGVSCTYVLWSIPSSTSKPLRSFPHCVQSGFMSSLWMCSCMYNTQKTCGFLQVQLVAWSWKVDIRKNSVNYWTAIILLKDIKEKSIYFHVLYLFRMTRACIVQGRYRKALSALTASTVLWATTSGLRGGKSWGNLQNKTKLF